MALLRMPSDYTLGTITLENGSDEFSGTDTAWELIGLREGDLLIDVEGATEFWAIIDEITSNVAGRLTRPWAGPSVTAAAYRMRFTSDGVRATAQAAMLRQQLGNGNLQALAGLEASANLLPMFTAPGVMTLVPRSELVSGAAYDVQVAELSDRDAYDGMDEGFAVLVANTGDGRAAIYSKLSNSNADWSDPAYVTGPSFELTIGDVEEIPFGEPLSVTLTPDAGGAALNFDLPKGMIIEAGSVTTLPPGEDADVDFVPITGGYRLDFSIPRGPTGDIDGVTPFWVSRLGADTDAEAARDGLDAEQARTLVSQSEAEEGTVTAVRSWTPERVRQAIQSLAPQPDEIIEKWGKWPVGAYYMSDGVTGVEEPPDSHPDFAWVLLTANQTGSGQYNEGKLGSQSVSGSAPLVQATAVVTDPDSPMNGQTIRLLNTENRYLMPAASGIGDVDNDQMQQITGSLTFTGTIVGIVTRGSIDSSGALRAEHRASETIASGVLGNGHELFLDSADSPNARTGNHTNIKRQNVRVYRCIKNIWSAS